MTGTRARAVPELVFKSPDPGMAITSPVTMPKRLRLPQGIVPRSASVTRDRSQGQEAFKAECYKCWATIRRFPQSYCIEWVHNHQCKEK